MKSAQAPQSIPFPARPSARYAAFLLLAVSAHAQGFRFFDPQDSLSVPKTISSSGLYQDPAAKRITPAAVPFDVNVALWSDGSAKQRWILLKPGTTVVFNDTGDYYKYPDGTVFVKNFSIDTVQGDSLSRILWETRLLVLKIVSGKERWFGFSYRWNPLQTDADLVGKEGREATLRTRAGRGGPVSWKKWKFPSRVECNTCHLTVSGSGVQGRSVLGFFAAQLNRPSRANPAINQLLKLFEAGIFQGPAPADFGTMPRWAPPGDLGAPLDIRARSYIGANCSGCHGSRGLEVGGAWGVDVNYDFHDMRPRMELVGRDVARTLGIEGARLIAPGRVDLSLLFLRQTFRDTAPQSFQGVENQMPPLGTFQEDTAATRMLAAWIQSMPVANGTLRTPRPGAGGAPFFREGMVYFPEDFADRGRHSMAGTGAPILSDARGRALPLTPSGSGRFRLRGPYAPGMHWVAYKGRTFSLVLF